MKVQAQDVKTQAHALAAIINEQFAREIPHKQALEFIARIQGYASLSAMEEAARMDSEREHKEELCKDLGWGPEDVQHIRPDLLEDEAYEVLAVARKRFDANEGLNWDILGMHADDTFSNRMVKVKYMTTNPDDFQAFLEENGVKDDKDPLSKGVVYLNLRYGCIAFEEDDQDDVNYADISGTITLEGFDTVFTVTNGYLDSYQGSAIDDEVLGNLTADLSKAGIIKPRTN